jgi:hypothetical protein
MELSQEDALRLNVLLANKPLAIRIHESRLTLDALSEQGEMSIQLSPNCRDEVYVRRVRQLLSSHVLGSPEGYPVYLRRWTRMGQTRSQESLEQLLLLGEPEAVVAVVHTPELDPELARRAWWAMDDADNARCLLSKPVVAQSPLGQELATYLAEYMPFEEDHLTLAESVRLILQDGLLSDAQKQGLWQRGRQKNAYYLGFLAALPDNLPEPLPPRADVEQLAARLNPSNPVAALVLRIASAPGQTYLDIAEKIIRKPINQDIVNRWLDVMTDYFQAMRSGPVNDLDLAALETAASTVFDEDGRSFPALAEVLQQVPELKPQLKTLWILARLSYAVVRPVLSHSDAIGSLMRRKLEPISTPLIAHLHVLRQPLSCSQEAKTAL